MGYRSWWLVRGMMRMKLLWDGEEEPCPFCLHWTWDAGGICHGHEQDFTFFQAVQAVSAAHALQEAWLSYAFNRSELKGFTAYRADSPHDAQLITLRIRDLIEWEYGLPITGSPW